jgi:hypothetical protein
VVTPDWYGETALESSLHLCKGYCLTGFRLLRQYWRQFWDTFFSGAYFPQKWDVLPPFYPRFNVFQKKNVASYLTKEAKVALYGPASSGSLRLSENARVSFLFCRGGAFFNILRIEIENYPNLMTMGMY